MPYPFKEGDVWFAMFPLEEDPLRFLPRPVIVLGEVDSQILAVKVTKTDPRDEDPFDTPIIFWREANLKFKSTARVSKTILLNKSQLRSKLGSLHLDDLALIEIAYMRSIT